MADDVMSFIFGGNTGLTLDQLKRRQAVATAIAAQKRKAPTTLGEGLTYLGESIGDRMQEERLNAAERDYLERFGKAAAGTPLPTASPGGVVPPPTAAVPAPVPTVPPAAAAPAAAATRAPPVTAPPPAPVGPRSEGPAAVPPTAFDTAPVAPNWRGADAGDAASPDELMRNRMTAALVNRASPDMLAMATPEVAQSNPTEGAPTAPRGGPPDDAIWTRRADAIAGIESAGARNPYTVVGPATVRRDGSVDRPYGRFQVMGSNVPSWTQAALGTPMTPQQFLASPEAQNAVFRHRFGQYVDRFGEEGAARAWLGGPGGVNNPNAADINGTTVGGYGRDYMNRLGGGGPRAAAPPGVQLAALNTGTMSDAPSIIPRIPGVTPDENEPTPTDIEKAPPQLLAQARPTTVTPGATPAPARPTPTITRIPGPLDKPEENPPPPAIERTVAPPPQPVYPPATVWEQQADDLMRRFPNDPAMAQHAQALAAYGKQVRDAQYARAVEVYQKQVEENMPTALLERRKGEFELAKAQQQEKERNALGGFTLEQLATPVTKSYDKNAGIEDAMGPLREARRLIADGLVFTGADAKLRYNEARAKAVAGMPPDPRIAGTERFLRNMAPLTAQMRQSLVGGQSVSDADREAAESAANGDIRADPKGMIATFDRIENGFVAAAINHQRKVLTYGGDDPNRQQKAQIYSLDMERIIPEQAVRDLIAGVRSGDAGAIREFDDHFKVPGLAERMLQRRGVR